MAKKKDIFDGLELPSDEEIREETRRVNNKKAINEPSVKNKKSENQKAVWTNKRPQVVNAIRTAIQNKWKDPEHIKKQKEGRKERYANPEKCGNFKSPIIGTNKITGKKETFLGAIQLKNAGFEPGNVYSCIAGLRKSHKGYTWARK